MILAEFKTFNWFKPFKTLEEMRLRSSDAD